MDIIDIEDLNTLTKDAYDNKITGKKSKYTKEEILNAMENYVKADPKKIKAGEHVKYFVNSKNVTKDDMDPVNYRAGGFCAVNKYPTYLVLCAGTKRWSVQVKKTSFFRQLTKKEVINDYEEALTEYEQICQKKVNKYKNKIKELKETETEKKADNNSVTDKMIEEIDVLRDELEHFETENAKYKKLVKKITEKYDSLRDKYDDMKEKYYNMEEKYYNMEEKYNKLKDMCH
jgi:hypothetical protein